MATGEFELQPSEQREPNLLGDPKLLKTSPFKNKASEQFEHWRQLK